MAAGTRRVERSRRHLGGDDDLVEIELEGGERQWVLETGVPRPEWRARGGGGPSRSAHPGTALAIAGELYEIVAIETSDRTRARYLLAPWDERDVVRSIATVEAGTSERALSRAREQVREHRAATALLLLAPFVGLLPAADQRIIERRYGISAALLTTVSALTLWVPASFLVVLGIAYSFAGQTPNGLDWVTRWLFVSLYVFVESAFRFASGWRLDEPLASLPGWLLGSLARVVTGRRSRRFAERDREPTAVSAERTAAMWVETFATFWGLLDTTLQAKLERRFAYDARRAVRESLVLTSVLGVSGAMSAFVYLGSEGRRVGDALVMVASLYLLAESIMRWAAWREGRLRGSLLGRPLRPVARRLIGRVPATLCEDTPDEGEI